MWQNRSIFALLTGSLIEKIFIKMSTYETNKAAIKTGGFACFTMGILLFGDPNHISIIAYIFKGVASLLTGFLSGFAYKLGGSIADDLKEKFTSKKNVKKKKNDRAA